MMAGGIWLEQALGAVAMIVIARTLGAEAFGVAAMAMVIIVAGEILVRETISEYLIQKADVTPGDSDAVFWIVLAAACMLAGAIALAAPRIAALYGAQQVAPLLQWGSLCIVSVAVTATPVALLRRELAFKTLAVRSALGAAIGGAAGIVAALMGAGAWSLVIQRLAQALANDGLIWLVHPYAPGRRATRAQVDAVLSFSARLIGVRAAEVASVHAPSVIIGAMLGPAALGYFTAAWRFVDTLTFLLTAPLRYVAQPAFAALKRGAADPGALLREIAEALSLVSFAALLGLAAVAEPLIVLAFGPDWIDAATPLRILCLAGAYYTIERLHLSFCIAMGETRAPLRLSVLEAGLSAGLMILAAPYGLAAVCWAMIAALISVWPLRLALLRRLTGMAIGPYLASYAPPLVVAATASLAAFAAARAATPFGSLTALAVGVGAGAALYALVGAAALRGRAARAWTLARAPRSASSL